MTLWFNNLTEDKDGREEVISDPGSSIFTPFCALSVRQHQILSMLIHKAAISEVGSAIIGWAKIAGSVDGMAATCVRLEISRCN